MKKQLKDRLYPLIPLFISLLVILATVGLFYYIKGYRFDFKNNEISTTGILTIDTVPSRSSLYIGEKEQGKTPKSITLAGGTYSVRIDRDGYHSWSKDIAITEGNSTSVYPWLIRKDISERSIFSTEKTVENEYIFQNDTAIFFLLSSDIEGSSMEETKNYEIWRLSTNSSAWNFSDNPNLILQFSTQKDTTVKILPSPDSSKILLSLIEEDSKSRYILEGTESNNLNNLQPITLNGFAEYDITWSNSNTSLLLESDTDILTYDIDTEIKYLITRKVSDTLYNFTTDNEGLIYIMEGVLEENIYNYSLSQYLANGKLQESLIPNIYFYKEDSYLKTYREDLTKEFSLPFTNSKESTKTSGKILSFSVEEDVNGMYITTEHGGYWYDLETSKFILVSPYNTDLLGVSPLGNKFVFKNDKELGVLIFKIEEGSSEKYVGERNIWDVNPQLVTDLQWFKNGKNILLKKEGSTFVSDTQGENMVNIYDNPTLFISTQQDPSDIFVADSEYETTFHIKELRIH